MDTNENDLTTAPAEVTEETKVEETKVQETDEAKLSRLKRQYEQQLKRMGVEPEEKPAKAEKTQDLDYGQKAYLVANGIKGSEEMTLVQDIMKNTGKSLDEVLESKYFQAELKEMREIKASAEAVPDSSKRSQNTAKDQVDYWIAKGELPPADQPQLRQAVVEAKIKAQRSSATFSSNPVVGG